MVLMVHMKIYLNLNLKDDGIRGDKNGRRFYNKSGRDSFPGLGEVRGNKPIQIIRYRPVLKFFGINTSSWMYQVVSGLAISGILMGVTGGGLLQSLCCTRGNRP